MQEKNVALEAQYKSLRELVGELLQPIKGSAWN